MRIPRIFHPEPLTDQQTVTLSEFAFRHAITVLRKGVGDQIVLFDGSGKDYTATLVEVSRREALAELTNAQVIQNESPLQTTLIQSVTKNDRMDYALQKATELGVNRIVPITTEWSGRESGKLTPKRIEHWQKVIIHACEQSDRSQLPELADVISLPEALRECQAEAKLLMSLTITSQKLPTQATSAAMLVGPIAGFTDQEEQLAVDAGFIPLHLSDRILRTETAGVVGLTLCQSRWGDFSHV